jgi:outer membrane immunogenic protein
MQLKSLIGVGLAAISLALPLASAQAADIPVKGYRSVVAYYNWTGLYVGINGGYGWGRSEWTDPTAVATTGKFNTKGAVFGGTFGYNYQVGSFVVGIEGDYDWSDIKGSSNAAICSPTIGCETKNSWLATVRGRVGYAFDRWLPYATGGLAYGNIKAASDLGTDTSTKAGYAVGAGVEYAFLSNWSAKLEYLYIHLNDGACNGACGTPVVPIDVKFNTNLIRAGLNYKFSGPIFSRY